MGIIDKTSDSKSLLPRSSMKISPLVVVLPQRLESYLTLLKIVLKPRHRRRSICYCGQLLFLPACSLLMLVSPGVSYSTIADER